MAKIHQFNAAARREIRETVRQVRGRTEGDRVGDRRTWPASDAKYVAFASEDIEHAKSGEVVLAEIDTESKITEITEPTDDQKRTAWNYGSKIWKGSMVLIQAVGVAPVDSDALEQARQFMAVHAFSATRIRAKTTEAINHGESGTVSGIVPLNGHYAPESATAEVHLKTEFVNVKAERVVWAELVYDATTELSRWEAYSADCDGGA